MTATLQTQPISLAEEFKRAELIWTRVNAQDTPSSNETEFKKLRRTATDTFTSCAEHVRALSLFSSNEILEDINTGDLRYLLVNAYLGDLLMKATDMAQRADTLQKAKGYFDAFLDQCERYAILNADDKRYLEEQIIGDGSRDAGARRQEKIARFKRNKAARSRIEELQKQIESQNSRNGGEDDDELDRDLVLTLIDLMVQKTLEGLVSIKQESEMLRIMEKERAENSSSSSASHDRSREDDHRIRKLDQQMKDQRLDMNGVNGSANGGPLLSKDGKPLRNFIITNKRQEFKDQVFRPGWRLPTMSIDDYLQQEMDRGNFLQGGGERPAKEEVDEDDHVASDAAVMKARDWDEFVEANPKGWGNRGNKG